MLLARLVVRLVHVAPDGNAEREPPHRRDDKRDPDAVKLPNPKVLAEQHEHQADDERHARPDVSPGVPLRRHFVVALLARRGIHKEGVVEHERRVQHDRRHHVDHEEHHRVGGNAHHGERHRARADGAGKELLLVALQIGEATEERHEQRQHKRGHRRRVSPGHNRRRIRVGNRREIDGDKRRCKKHVGGIAHVVEDPAALGFRHMGARQRNAFHSKFGKSLLTRHGGLCKTYAKTHGGR